MSDFVLFEEITTSNNFKVAVATLNSEKSLNALSLDMVRSLYPKLNAWAQDEKIAMVILQGAGEKAFCAGGDVVDLYHASVAIGKGNYAKEVEEFFTEEYKLDHLIHTYKKPIMLWGHGIVMGGGLGLMAGASHRVVTEKSRIAMPEITIGLYPDVGGTYFLNRMPEGCGLFLGLTGASINAKDALYINLADHAVNSTDKDALISQLEKANWDISHEQNHKTLTSILMGLEANAQIPDGNIHNHKEIIASLANTERVESAVVNILDEQTDDKWFTRAQASLKHGSPLSAQLVFNQLQHGKGLGLAECFQFELGLSVHCAAIGEFAEGVRALLIDKDNQPNWMFESVTDVDKALITKMMTPPWSEDAHPLKDLA